MTQERKDFQFINELSKTEATIRLSGVIGKDINGHEFAHELDLISSQVSKINLVINCEGGDMIQGFSIVSAIQRSGATVTAKIEGIAASMASVIAMACDSIEMADFSRIMIHDPMINGAKKLSAKQKNTLSALKSSIMTIYSGRVEIAQEKLSNLMSQETWFTPEKAIKEGFADSMYTTGFKASLDELLETFTVGEVVNQVSNHFNKTKTKNMNDQIIAALNLGEGAEESAVVEAINGLNTNLTEKETELSSVKNELETKSTENDVLVGRVAASLVDGAIAQGKFKKDLREELIEKASKDLDGFESIVASIEPKVVNKLINKIDFNAKDKGKGKKDDSEKSFDWYQKNDPIALNTMMNEDHETFMTLFNAQFN